MTRSTRRASGGIPVPLQKRYGQHHLTQASLCAPLIDFLKPAGRLVIEIGPGGGVLTQRLAAAGARVLALEIDLAWAATLAAGLSTRDVRLVVSDATRWAWSRVPSGTLVAGNLPFNVGTVLIDQVLEHWPEIPRAGFLVQKEVADRLAAGPGEEAYGALSVLTAARARVHRLGRVSRGSFRPPPKVDGAFVGLELMKPVVEPSVMPGFMATVRLCFAQRRKQLRNALAAGWGRDLAELVLRQAGVDPRCRAEELGLTDFVELNRAHLDAESQRSDEQRV